MTRAIESFDHYNGIGTITGVGARWSLALSGDNNSAMIAGRYGGQALKVESGGSFSTATYWLSFDNIDEFSVSLAFRFFGANATTFIGFGNTSSPQFHLRQTGSNTLGLYRGSTNLWASDSIYPQFVWHTLRIKGTVHNSAGALHVSIDNDEVYSATGIDTTNLATAYINSIIVAANGAIAYIDDIVLIDDNTDYLPECRIQTLPSNADGSNLDLVPSTGSSHYPMVDESPVVTTDYLSGSVAGDYDLLELPALSTNPLTIVGLNLVGFADKTDAASRAWNLGIVSDGTTDLGADRSLTSSVQYYSRLLETDPATGLAWLPGAIGGGQTQLMPRVAV